MFERLSRSWQLVKASGAVLQQDKELLLFPLISSLATIVVVAAFLLLVATFEFANVSGAPGVYRPTLVARPTLLPFRLISMVETRSSRPLLHPLAPPASLAVRHVHSRLFPNANRPRNRRRT